MVQDNKIITSGLVCLLALTQWPFSVGNLDLILLRNSMYVIASIYFILSMLIDNRRKLFLQRLTTPPVFLLLSAILVSTIVSGSLTQTSIGDLQKGDGAIAAFVVCVGMLALVTRVRTVNHRWIYLSGSAGAFGSLLYFLSSGAYLTGERAAGIMGQPILFATFLAIGYIYGFAYRRQLNLSLGVWVLLQAQLFLLIVTTMTRAVIIPVIIYTTYELLLLRGLKNYRKQLRDKLPVFTVMILLLGTVFISSGAAYRTLNPSKMKYAIEFRLAMIGHAVSQADIVPFLGYGHGQIFANMGVYKTFPAILEAEVRTGKADVLDSTHNMLVDFWLQYGVLGLISISWLIFLGLQNGIGARHRSTEARFLLFALLIVLLQVMVNPAFPEIRIIMWLLLFRLIFEFRKPSRRKLPAQAMLCFVFGLMLLLFVLYNADTAKASKRLSRVIVFPLRTTKDLINRGSAYEDVTLLWAHDRDQNYHHDYQAADLHVKPGTEVLAAVPGTVVFARHSACTGDTFPAIIIHGYDGLYYLYSHLAEGSIPYYVDQPVDEGAVIGKVGDSRCAQNAAPHLHFDISRVYEPHRGTWYSEIVMVNAQAPLVRAFQQLPD